MESAHALKKQKPEVEVSPDFVNSKRELKLVGNLSVRPATRRKRKVRHQRLSPDRNSTWESSAAASTFDINYADTSFVAEIGLKKRKTKSPSKTLTNKSISENVRRLTAESNLRKTEINNLQEEVKRLSKIVGKLTGRIGN